MVVHWNMALRFAIQEKFYSKSLFSPMKSLLSRIKKISTSTDAVANDIDITDTNVIADTNALAAAEAASDETQRREEPLTYEPQRVHIRRRYRGFSTSISSLFLDDQVVCSAVSCCGILASTRTEHLLTLRNSRKGVTEPAQLSSKIVSFSFILTILSLSLTYLIWGSNSISTASSTRLLTHNSSFKRKGRFIQLRLYKEHIWDPIFLYEHPQPYTETGNHNDAPINSVSLVHASSSSSQRILDDYPTHSNTATTLRILIIISFLLILGVLGRQRRLQVRYDILKARLQEDSMSQTYSMTMNRDSYLVETASQGACSHTLFGCYPIDRNDHSNSTQDGHEQDVSQRIFSTISSLCCGFLCKTWIQCFSCCALAQEAREARLLVPPKLQRIDLITNQPFDAYYKDIYALRRGWKGFNSDAVYIHGWKPQFRALSSLSHSLVIIFIVVVAIVTLTVMINPLFSFTLGDAFVILCTFGQSFIVLGIVHGIFHKSDLSLDAVIKFYSIGFLLATSASIVFEGIILNVFIALYYAVILFITMFTGVNVQNFGEENYFGFMVAMVLIESYFVAALAEEFSKYYTFRTVEHPDLIFLTGLDRSKQEDSSKIGGDNAYPFSLDNASALVNEGGYFEADYAQAIKASKHYRGVNPAIRELGQLRSSSEGGEADENPEVRTLNQQAAAVTTALISTAVGLACAENFLYVFVLNNGTSTKEEVVLLIFRSLFPVHALCAALQSTSIIRKFLENHEADSKRIGVGRIVLPAILLHGTFDSVIMVVNLCIEKYSNAQSIINVIGGFCLVLVMLGGTMWYYNEHRNQQQRLSNHNHRSVQVGGKSLPALI